MVATSSSMVHLGSQAADFRLPDVTSNGTEVGLQDFDGTPILVMFICNHCPYVVHLISKLTELANQYQDKGFSVIAISSNDVENYPQDSPERMAEFALLHGFKFPYCYDESQAIARAYGAECTPDFFVYDANHKLRYRGQMDGSRPSNGVPVSGQDLEDAMSAILSAREVNPEQVPSIGCNIKWKATN